MASLPKTFKETRVIGKCILCASDLKLVVTVALYEMKPKADSSFTNPTYEVTGEVISATYVAHVCHRKVEETPEQEFDRVLDGSDIPTTGKG